MNHLVSLVLTVVRLSPLPKYLVRKQKCYSGIPRNRCGRRVLFLHVWKSREYGGIYRRRNLLQNATALPEILTLWFAPNCYNTMMIFCAEKSLKHLQHGIRAELKQLRKNYFLYFAKIIIGIKVLRWHGAKRLGCFYCCPSHPGHQTIFALIQFWCQ